MRPQCTVRKQRKFITIKKGNVEMKITIIILSDPKGGEEALGRVFNALALAHEALQVRDEVEIVFNGTGGALASRNSLGFSHPANGLSP